MKSAPGTSWIRRCWQRPFLTAFLNPVSTWAMQDMQESLVSSFEMTGLIDQAAFTQPCGLNIRTSEGGYVSSNCAGRIGRSTNPPPQFGHFPRSTFATQSRQKVHSNEQINASVESGARSRSQHSHPGRIWSIAVSFRNQNSLIKR